MFGNSLSTMQRIETDDDIEKKALIYTPPIEESSDNSSQGKYNLQLQDQVSSHQISRFSLLIFLFFSFAFGASLVAFKIIRSEPSQPDITDFNIPSSSSNFTLYRTGYSPLTYFTANASEYLKYKILDGYSAVIEPSASMNLYSSAPNSNSYYRYTLCVETDCYSGYNYPSDATKSSSVTVPCEAFQDYSFIIDEFSLTDDSWLTSTSLLAKCMYVRREIRKMTDEDVAMTMDTLLAFYNATSNDSVSALDLMELHYFHASWPDSGEYMQEHIRSFCSFVKY